MRKADFFIIGAPKSGTTSLYEYLRTHPDICFSDSKEPHYFSFDFPGYCTTKSLDEYHQKEFGHCSAEQSLLGEASVWYLYSKVAVSEIHKYNPDAKILIMLRNPVDMLYSLHSQMLYNLDEESENFEEAWSLQEARSEGRSIPSRCRVPEFLQYRQVGSFGEQVARVYDYFPSSQIKVILFDEFAKESHKVYLEVLSFLGIDDDGRTDFEIANPNKSMRFKPLTVFIERPPRLLVSFVSLLKRLTGVHRFGVYRVLNKINEKVNAKKTVRKTLSPEFRQTISRELKDDIERLENVAQLDLSKWKADEGTVN